MTAATTHRKIQAPELEAQDNALADLRAAESLVASALASAQTAQWSDQMHGEIGRVLHKLRNLLQDLS